MQQLHSGAVRSSTLCGHRAVVRSCSLLLVRPVTSYVGPGPGPWPGRRTRIRVSGTICYWEP